MKRKPAMDELIDELENLVQCLYYDQVTESYESGEALDFVLAAYKRAFPDRYNAAIDRARAEIIEEGSGHLLEEHGGVENVV